MSSNPSCRNAWATCLASSTAPGTDRPWGYCSIPTMRARDLSYRRSGGTGSACPEASAPQIHRHSTATQARMASPIDRRLPFFHGHYNCSGTRNFPVLEVSLGYDKIEGSCDGGRRGTRMAAMAPDCRNRSWDGGCKKQSSCLEG